jgi:hypothetical protein
MEDICKRIAEMAASVDDDPAIPKGDHEWRKGYKQACSDIVIMLELLNQQEATP